MLVERVNTAISSAFEFLATHQEDNGCWRDFCIPGNVGRSDEWVTAYVAFTLASHSRGLDQLKSPLGWLIDHSRDGRGWGYRSGLAIDADSTSNGLMFLFRVVSGGSSGQSAGIMERLLRGRLIDRARLLSIAASLDTFSDPNGGFRTYRPPPAPTEAISVESAWCDSHVSVTALATEALHTVSSFWHAQSIARGLKFVARQQNSAGFWKDFWWQSLVYPTYVSSRCLVAAGDSTPAKRAVRWIISSQTVDGGMFPIPGAHCTAFDTALSILVLALLPKERDAGKASERAVAWLLQSQKPSGGWAGDATLLVPPQINVDAVDVELDREAVFVDDRGIFSTATALRALQEWKAATLYGMWV